MAHPLIDSDVYNRIGGQRALTELMDPNGNGTWDVSMLELAMGDAWNFVVDSAGVQVELSGQTNAEIRANFPSLITIAALKALPFAWLNATGGQALPDGILRYDTLADQHLVALSERRKKHGAVGYEAPISQRVARVDLDPEKNRMTLESFRSGGFI